MGSEQAWAQPVVMVPERGLGRGKRRCGGASVGVGTTGGDGSGEGVGGGASVGVGVGVGVGIAVGCGATVAVGFGVCEGSAATCGMGVGIAAVTVGATAGVGEGCGGPLWRTTKNDCSNSESGQHNQGAARIRQTRTLPVFGLENGQRHQHYTIRYLAHLRRVEPRTSVVMPKIKTRGSPQGRYHPARMVSSDYVVASSPLPTSTSAIRAYCVLRMC